MTSEYGFGRRLARILVRNKATGATHTREAMVGTREGPHEAFHRKAPVHSEANIVLSFESAPEPDPEGPNV